MTGIQLPKHLYRGQYCEMQNRSNNGATSFNSNLLQAHLIQMQRMQNPDKNGENINNPTYIDLSILYQQTTKDENDAKAKNVNVVEIVRRFESGGEGAKVMVEKEMEETTDQPSSSASVHVVDELRKVLESRKRTSEPSTSRDKEKDEEMEVASSFSEQVGQNNQINNSHKLNLLFTRQRPGLNIQREYV